MPQDDLVTQSLGGRGQGVGELQCHPTLVLLHRETVSQYEKTYFYTRGRGGWVEKI